MMGKPEEDVSITGGEGDIQEVITCKEGDQAQEHMYGYHTRKWLHTCQRDGLMEREDDNRGNCMDGEQDNVMGLSAQVA